MTALPRSSNSFGSRLSTSSTRSRVAKGNLASLVSRFEILDPADVAEEEPELSPTSSIQPSLCDFSIVSRSSVMVAKQRVGSGGSSASLTGATDNNNNTESVRDGSEPQQGSPSVSRSHSPVSRRRSSRMSSRRPRTPSKGSPTRSSSALSRQSSVAQRRRMFEAKKEEQLADIDSEPLIKSTVISARQPGHNKSFSFHGRQSSIGSATSPTKSTFVSVPIAQAGRQMRGYKQDTDGAWVKDGQKRRNTLQTTTETATATAPATTVTATATATATENQTPSLLELGNPVKLPQRRAPEPMPVRRNEPQIRLSETTRLQEASISKFVPPKPTIRIVHSVTNRAPGADSMADCPAGPDAIEDTEGATDGFYSAAPKPDKVDESVINYESIHSCFDSFDTSFDTAIQLNDIPKTDEPSSTNMKKRHTVGSLRKKFDLSKSSRGSLASFLNRRRDTTAAPQQRERTAPPANPEHRRSTAFSLLESMRTPLSKPQEDEVPKDKNEPAPKRDAQSIATSDLRPFLDNCNKKIQEVKDSERVKGAWRRISTSLGGSSNDSAVDVRGSSDIKQQQQQQQQQGGGCMVRRNTGQSEKYSLSQGTPGATGPVVTATTDDDKPRRKTRTQPESLSTSENRISHLPSGLKAAGRPLNMDGEGVAGDRKSWASKLARRSFPGLGEPSARPKSLVMGEYTSTSTIATGAPAPQMPSVSRQASNKERMGRRLRGRFSRSSDPLVAAAGTPLEQPKPMRVNEVQRFVSFCKEKVISRRASTHLA